MDSSPFFSFFSFFYSDLIYLVRAKGAAVAGEVVPLLEEGGVEASSVSTVSFSFCFLVGGLERGAGGRES